MNRDKLEPYSGMVALKNPDRKIRLDSFKTDQLEKALIRLESDISNVNKTTEAYKHIIQAIGPNTITHLMDQRIKQKMNDILDVVQVIEDDKIKVSFMDVMGQIDQTLTVKQLRTSTQSASKVITTNQAPQQKNRPTLYEVNNDNKNNVYYNGNDYETPQAQQETPYYKTETEKNMSSITNALNRTQLSFPPQM